MHAAAVIRGCIFACTAGAFCALLLIVAAAAALSPEPPEWGRILPTVLGAAFLLSLPLTGIALLAAWLAARRRATATWWQAGAGGGVLGALAGALIGPIPIVALFGALGVATGLCAWVAAFGPRRAVPFGAD
ncbi:hypothetical protein SAMN04488012_10941 [Palleronia salina]|uniref:Uncharacterized protein n=1 Tax=Palleronia salina TaxID=313368 RepID=A0A1M6J710_9RHOB|nr:hypothetical protein [Palleronia salina]SHJ42461.1 hypothetical protein SAMN04488012_10941 [Palleronia salina]